jgi:hypothetical protein
MTRTTALSVLALVTVMALLVSCDEDVVPTVIDAAVCHEYTIIVTLFGSHPEGDAVDLRPSWSDTNKAWSTCELRHPDKPNVGFTMPTGRIVELDAENIGETYVLLNIELHADELEDAPTECAGIEPSHLVVVQESGGDWNPEKATVKSPNPWGLMPGTAETAYVYIHGSDVENPAPMQWRFESPPSQM